MNIHPYFKKAMKAAENNAPKLLTGAAVGGVLTTAYLAAKAAPEAVFRLHELELEDAGIVEKTKVTWKLFIPAAASGAGTIGCIIASQTINDRRQAALAGLYTISERTLMEYKEELLTALGEEGADEVRKNVAQRTANPDHSFAPSPDGTAPTQVIVQDDSEQTCHDAWSGRYFKSSRNTIEKARNDANALILLDGYITVNEFYSRLGLDYIDAGNIMGWDADNLIDFAIDAVVGPDTKPCLSIQHRVAPKPFGRYGDQIA